MFFAAGQHQEAGLPHDPFKAIVAPRPIGWISAISGRGDINLSPYSFFNALNSRPPLVMFSSEGAKDAVSFIAETGEFVCSLVSADLAERMNMTSAPLPRGENEFIHAGLTMAPSQLVKPPRVAEAAAALECKVLELISPNQLSGAPAGCHIVIGQVVGVYIDDRFLGGGRLNTAAMRPMARMGYDEYAVVERAITITRPPGAGNFNEKPR
ncbi:MAG: flavin reductase family protein [Methylocystis sp.]|jgi:flavin reductase (DIM6/NTAB) family NADH-FMN oxidoreductase RutF|nr:flavin reductase family protein [Methylocystis sp.]MCA3583544.1 flavin reductase family protein [Methylocystis sp.]MCA3589686.1 flavin reductase family protein [Methylocystis sp.]MCA3592147.1 flavin reductase family protein [Methylocystis sp.]